MENETRAGNNSERTEIEMERETVLITGAGSGIRREFARLFHRDGARVLAVSLIREELESLATELSVGPGEMVTFQKDLSRPESAQEVFDWIESSGYSANILINNAGYGVLGEHLEQDYDRIQRMMTLNMVTLTGLTTLLGRKMKERGGGRILNVASTTSFQPVPYLAAYAATKHYVAAFSEALARELESHNITVTCLCPGTTDTAFLTGCGVDRNNRKGSVGQVAFKVAMTPADVAASGYRALRAGRIKAVPGITNKLHRIATNITPNRLITLIVRAFFRERPVN